MKLYFWASLIFATSLSLSSCTSLPINASNVSITKKPAPSSCKWLGKVSVIDESRAMSAHDHHALLIEEMNQLRTQAANLGANTVVLSSNSGMITEGHTHSKLRHQNTGTHQFYGNAYSCP